MEATAAENVVLDTEIDSGKLIRALQKADCRALSDRPQKAMIGVLFDKGSHEELAGKEGVYAEMWRMQHQAFS
ncbi:MAG: hypothetical protein HFH95_10275 [Lachnospiraceae bacterium]|nr:hypothetical protein [uncultured Acetatifactor sp.]MCI8543679.1 hypothetical protein [Lachnospiraceae bacterium]